MKKQLSPDRATKILKENADIFSEFLFVYYNASC